MGKGSKVSEAFNTIVEAINDLKVGKMVIVVDDENRENEGDFIMPAQIVTAADVNFMATHGRGLICAPVSSQIATSLHLPLMYSDGADHQGTAFTVSIDAANDITTGISAEDRMTTLRLIADPNAKSSDLVRPGHIFPLIAKDGGVLSREGHTEAAVDLATMAGYTAAGVICEILNEDGTCARVPDLKLLAKKFDLKLISIEALKKFKQNN
jgi:3,4-dihydroxy 2-butanone 4-phosphate synthase/GTP cyclohydrolase II